MRRRDDRVRRAVGLALLGAVVFLPFVAQAVDVTVTATISDTTAPTVAITAPAAGVYTSATIPVNFTGTAADNSNGVGLNANSTVFALKRQSDGLYWNGSVWTAGIVYLGTTHPATVKGDGAAWTSSAILPPWFDGAYEVVARAVDKAGNSADSAAVAFTINTPALGLLTVAQPVGGTTYTAATIPGSFTGTVQDAADGLGFFGNSVEFTIRRASDDKYWNGSAWVVSPVYLHTTHADTVGGTETAWTSAATLPPWLDDDYTVVARGTSKGGTLLTSSAVTFTVKNEAAPPPSGGEPETPGGTVTPPPPTIVPPTVDTVSGWIVNLIGSENVNYLLAALTLLGTVLLGLLPSLLNLPLGLPAAIGPLGNLFAFFIAWLKRRRRYGVVYDSVTGKPIEGVAVRLFAEGGSQFEAGKLLGSKHTDAKGRFAFDVNRGMYRLEAVMPEYAFPSRRASVGYRGELLEATEDGLVYPDIPIDSLTPGGHAGVQRFRELGERIQQLRIPLSVVGTIFGIAFFIERGARIDYVIMVMYVVFWTLEYLNWIQGREVAYVTAADNRPVPLTVLRLYDSAGRLRATRVSDLRGRYSIFTGSGTYLLDAVNRSFDLQSHEVRMRMPGIVPTRIKLTRREGGGTA